GLHLEGPLGRERASAVDHSRTVGGFGLDQDRRTVGGQHDVELDAAEAGRRREPNCGGRVLGGERPAAAMGDDSGIGRAHDAREYIEAIPVNYAPWTVLTQPRSQYPASRCACWGAAPRRIPFY